MQEVDKQKLMDEISGEYLKLQEYVNHSKDKLQDYIEDKINIRNNSRKNALNTKSKLEKEIKERKNQLETLGRKLELLQEQEEEKIEQEMMLEGMERRAKLAGCVRLYELFAEKYMENPRNAVELVQKFEGELQEAEKRLSMNKLKEKAELQRELEERRTKRQREAGLSRRNREEAEVYFLRQALTEAQEALGQVQQEQVFSDLVPLLQVPEFPVPTAEATATLQDISVDVDTSIVPSQRRDAEYENTTKTLEEQYRQLQGKLTQDTDDYEEVRMQLATVQAKLQENEERYDILKKADLENTLEERRQLRNQQLQEKRERQEREEKAWEAKRQAYYAQQHSAVLRSAILTLQERLPASKYPSALLSFLEEKHELEFSHLRQLQTREQRFIHNSLIEEVYKRKISDLHLIRKEFRLRRLRHDKSKPDYQQKLTAVLNAEREVISRLDYICAQDLQDLLEKAGKDLRRKQAQEITALIDRHIEEVRVVGEKELNKTEIAELERVLTGRKTHLEEEIQRKARLFDQRKTEVALRRVQQQQDLENLVRLEREIESKQSALRLESQLIREKEAKIREFEWNLRARNISEEEMEVMLEEYVSAVASADQSQAKEREKQTAILAQKLAERKRRKIEIQDSLERIKQEQNRWKMKVGTMPGLRHKGANKLLNRWRRYPKRPIKEVAARLTQTQPVPLI